MVDTLNTEPHNESERNGRSAISREVPLREVNQEVAAGSERQATARPARAELTDEEVSILCDVDEWGAAKSREHPLVQGLIERGFIDIVSEGPLKQLKLTPRAQRLLSERGVGLDEAYQLEPFGHPLYLAGNSI